MKASLEVDIIDESMTASIEAVLVQALNNRSDVLVKEIVQSALSETTGYGKQKGAAIAIKSALQKAIQAEAQKAVQQLVDNKQAEIQAAVAAEVAKIVTPEFIAGNVVVALQRMTTRFSLSSTKPSQSGDDDDDLEN